MSKKKTNKTDNKDKKIIVSKLSPKIDFSKPETLDSETLNIKPKKKTKSKKVAKENRSNPQNKNVKVMTEKAETIKKEDKQQENKSKDKEPQMVKSQKNKKKEVKSTDAKSKEANQKGVSTDKNAKIAGTIHDDASIKVAECKTVQIKSLTKPIMFIVFAIILEVLNFKLIEVDWFSTLPTKFGMEIGIILFYAGIIYAVPKSWIQTLLMYLFLTIFAIISVINQSLMNLQGFSLNLSMIKLLGEAKESFSIDFVDLGSLITTILVFCIMIFFQVVIDKILSFKIKIKSNLKTIIPLSACLIFLCFGTTSYAVTRSNLTDYERKLYTYQNSSQGFIQKYGTLSILTQALSIKDKTLTDEQLLKNIEENNVQVNSDAPLFGDNLIMLMVESLDSFAIDPYNTPTLYSLTQNGYFAKNYYSNNKTNISEFICLNGYVPNDTKVTLESDHDLAVKYSLPNLFKSQGYSANYFHSYTGNFYNRNTLNIQMGFEDVIDCIDAGIEPPTFCYWNTEQEYLSKVIEKLAPNDGSKFMSFYLTVASHGSYEIALDNFNEYKEIYDNNLENFKKYLEDNNYIYPTSEYNETILREYKSRIIETDFMIKQLIEYLDETGLSENTTLVIFCDHNTFYHDLSYKIKGTSRTNYSQIDSYNVPLIFYSKKITPKISEDFCTVTDIYTSICELYGLGYNKFFNQGNNLFSENEKTEFMYSKLTGYYDPKFYGMASDLIQQNSKNKTYSEEEKQEFSNKIIDFTDKQIQIMLIINKKMKA